MFINGPYNKIALQTGDSSAGCGVIVKRMVMMKENRKLMREILKDVRRDMTDEEVLNLLADSKISENPAGETYSLGQRAADTIARFAGSWAFIFSFTGVLVLWMVINVVLAATQERTKFRRIKG